MTDFPFTTKIKADERVLENADKVSETKLSDMIELFQDKNAARTDAAKTVYRVYKRDVPLLPGELLQCITEILPGTCGDEFFMTKGHGHADGSCAEIYLGVRGSGLVLMQKGNEFCSEEITAGTAVYIPGGWNHRTVNVSTDESVVFYSVWPAQSGYDYTAVSRNPYSFRVMKEFKGWKLVRGM